MFIFTHVLNWWSRKEEPRKSTDALVLHCLFIQDIKEKTNMIQVFRNYISVLIVTMLKCNSTNKWLACNILVVIAVHGFSVLSVCILFILRTWECFFHSEVQDLCFVFPTLYSSRKWFIVCFFKIIKVVKYKNSNHSISIITKHHHQQKVRMFHNMHSFLRSQKTAKI